LVMEKQEPPPHDFPLVNNDAYWAACDLANALPEDCAVGRGHLYLVGFSTGIVKVGMTAQPRRRIRDHIHRAAPYGVDVLNVWLSNECDNCGKLEQRLLQSLKGRWFSPVGHEYFRVDFAEAVATACRITTK